MKATNTLFGECTTPRPQEHNRAYDMAAARDLLVELKQHWGEAEDDDQEDDDDEEEDGILSTLADGIAYRKNGYEMVRDLERHGVMGDAEAVDLCENASAYSYWEQDVKAWVEKEGIQASLRVDDEVTVTIKGSTVDGVITNVYEKTANYVVCVEAHGHVRKGVGSHGYILAYEVVETAENLERNEARHAIADTLTEIQAAFPGSGLEVHSTGVTASMPPVGQETRESEKESVWVRIRRWWQSRWWS